MVTSRGFQDSSSLFWSRFQLTGWNIALFIGLCSLISVTSDFRINVTAIALLYYFAVWAIFSLFIQWLTNKSYTLAFIIVCVVTSWILAELVSFYATGVHMNTFLISTLLFNDTGHSGIPILWLFATILLIAVVLCTALRSMSFETDVRIGTGFIIALFSLGAAISMYSVNYFSGDTGMLHMKRNLPFFIAPDRWYIRKAINYFWNEQLDNPFSLKQQDNNNLLFGSSPFQPLNNKSTNVTSGSAPNILLVVADSWRSYDLTQNKNLMPKLLSFAERGRINFDHYAVSPCTHFSFYTMFTGRLPTSFSRQRRSANGSIYIKSFKDAGYSISTAEAFSLDWYDTGRTIFGDTATRKVADNTSQRANDQFVTQETLKLFRNKAGDAPIFHLAYYYGTHFPYGTNAKETMSDALEAYHSSISALDNELALLIKGLKDQGRLQDTIIMITSDHGEEVLENGKIGHSSSLNDLQTKVPMALLGTNIPLDGLKDHRMIMPYLYHAAGLGKLPAAKPTILAECHYAFPTGFKVETKSGFIPFDFEDGYLNPLEQPSQFKGGVQTVKQAAAYLLKEAY